MNFRKVQEYKYELSVVIVILVLIIYKLPFLYLPYYYDEAWPYSVAVGTMYHHGLSFLPTAIDPFISRGHPLMFFFLAAAWMKIFGTSLLSGHCFALSVSVLVIITVYLFCKAFFSKRVGLVAAILLTVQAIFIAQSAFLMPEVLMGLWTMLCFYTFFKNHKIFYVVIAAAMLLTKESGGVMFIALAFYESLQFLFSRDKNIKILVRKVLFIMLPVLIASIYFIIQKIDFGWFLFPFYMDYISSGWMRFVQKLPDVAAYLFIYDGRNGLSFFIILSLIAIIFGKARSFTKNEKRVLSALICFVVLFALFCSVNYYIPRYLFCAFPPFIIIGVVIMDKVFGSNRLVYTLLITGLAITSIFYYVQPKSAGDMDYSSAIKANMQLIDYCGKSDLYNNYIFTTCVLRYDLTEPYVGFIKDKRFTNVQWDFSDKTEYCIFSKDEYDGPLFDKIKKEKHLMLVKRVTDGVAWCELYKVIRE